MAIVNVYIKFKGNTEEAMSFYKNALGGEFIATLRYGDAGEVADDIKKQNYVPGACARQWNNGYGERRCRNRRREHN